MPAIGTRDIDYKKKNERERAKRITRECIDFPQSLPTIFLWNVFRKPMKRDGRSSRLSVAIGIANFYSSIGGPREKGGRKGMSSGNPRDRYHYHAPFVIKCGVNVIKRFKYSRAQLWFTRPRNRGRVTRMQLRHVNILNIYQLLAHITSAAPAPRRRPIGDIGYRRRGSETRKQRK